MYKTLPSQLVLLLSCLMLMSLPVRAEPTDLRVLVRAADAKFIGSMVGGMNIHIEDVQSGALLAVGQVRGDTGDTPGLMTEGQVRGHAPVQEGDASFSTSLDIDRPRQLKISVRGPLSTPQSIQAASVSLWLVPGRHQTSPGVILQLPGLITELQAYRLEQGQLSVTALVSMLCGCPITAEGLWRADDFLVMAQLYQAGSLVQEAPLAFTGNTNEFAGVLEAADRGDYELLVYAWQESTGNTGVFRQALQFP